MPFYYFIKVPPLPPEVQHQNGSVEVLEYLAREGSAVAAGTPLLRAENWWAQMEFDAIGPGIVLKTFFDPGTRVRIGDPFVIVGCDGEDAPHGRELAGVRIIHAIRAKPTGKGK